MSHICEEIHSRFRALLQIFSVDKMNRPVFDSAFFPTSISTITEHFDDVQHYIFQIDSKMVYRDWFEAAKHTLAPNEINKSIQVRDMFGI